MRKIVAVGGLARYPRKRGVSRPGRVIKDTNARQIRKRPPAMTMNFPAYWGDPTLKREVLARAGRTDWQSGVSLDDLLPPDNGAGPQAGSPLHRLTGFPADLKLLADTFLRHLPVDRRGRFAVAVFEAPDVGADLAPVADRFLETAAKALPEQARSAVVRPGPVKDYGPKLEAIMVQSAAQSGGLTWLWAADALIEILSAATPP
jgi:hypothetical protein